MMKLKANHKSYLTNRRMKEVQIVMKYLSSITSEGHAKLQQKVQKMKIREQAGHLRIPAFTPKSAMADGFIKRKANAKKW